MEGFLIVPRNWGSAAFYFLATCSQFSFKIKKSSKLKGFKRFWIVKTQPILNQFFLPDSHTWFKYVTKNIERYFLKNDFHIYLVAKIWLNLLMDDHDFDYITKWTQKIQLGPVIWETSRWERNIQTTFLPSFLPSLVNRWSLH
jgi:hypothetical protein